MYTALSPTRSKDFWRDLAGMSESPKDRQLEVLPDGGRYMSQVVDLASVVFASSERHLRLIKPANIDR
jgi:hypothetical protein